ncbi:hypothetical protein [Hyphomicrobium sp.]|uniref:hypothetical protein n=1 Tax=Hyphomicrobium sp. TaxID=82 RepID=UPI002D76B41D|nr:hypothetical protein [Hyphomicrobium sp.]HET6388580.1 hypothetical protein [Hyphomicrobium sp.]
MLELHRAREALADAEAQVLAGFNPYAATNVATQRARVARLEADLGLPISFLDVPRVDAAAGSTPARRSNPAPGISGTREERLQRLAKTMDADEAHLARAIAAGTSPDEYAIEILDSRDPDAVARRIVNSDRPAARTAACEIEEMAQRILNA